jgi:hypothetical protein
MESELTDLRDSRQFPLRVESGSVTGDSVVDALLREREDYVAKGLDDRVGLVDEQLVARGYRPDGKGGAR